MTLGPGTFGGSIISENVSAKHMFNVKRLAFETRPINPPEDRGATKSEIRSARSPSDNPLRKESFGQSATPAPVSHHPPGPVPHPATSKSWMEEIEERIRLKAANPTVGGGITAPRKEEHIPAAMGTGKLGSGIAEEEVERIMKEFLKK
jgi:hypothetical protein